MLQKQNATLRQTLRLSSGLRQRFEVLFDASPLGLFTHDAEERIVEANLALANLLQVKRAQLIGQHIGKFIAPQDHAHFIQHLTRLRDNNKNGDSAHCTIALMTSQQTQIKVRMKSTMQTANIIHGRISPLGSTNQCLADLANCNAELQKEINEHELAAEEQSRRHQEKLAHVSRLNTMGEMAAGLAHEINQPLTAISSYVRSCLRLLEGDEKKRAQVPAILEQACNQAQRAANIIHHLRDFVSKSASHRETIELSNVVQLATTMMRTEFHANNITLNIETLADMPLITADAIQLEQVVLNLLRNASEAMNSPQCPRHNRHLNIVLDKPATTHVRISVSDTGPGIPLDDMKKILTPFFSTKTNGMGLGLAISRTIVEDHGGKLTHKPNRKGGVTFMFTLAIDGKTITHH
ncbi:MAG: PAS domain-containing protein [Gammaproteobacteria bacterium]|nr:PAS domain-containing protein [Gammaproteobacteria bacterium]